MVPYVRTYARTMVVVKSLSRLKIYKLHYNILADHLEMQNNQIAEDDDVEEPYDKSEEYWRYIS